MLKPFESNPKELPDGAAMTKMFEEHSGLLNALFVIEMSKAHAPKSGGAEDDDTWGFAAETHFWKEGVDCTALDLVELLERHECTREWVPYTGEPHVRVCHVGLETGKWVGFYAARKVIAFGFAHEELFFHVTSWSGPHAKGAMCCLAVFVFNVLSLVVVAGGKLDEIQTQPVGAK